MSSGIYKLTKDVFNILFISFLLLSFTNIIQTHDITETSLPDKSDNEDYEFIPKAFIFKLTFTGLLASLWCNRNMIKIGIF